MKLLPDSQQWQRNEQKYRKVGYGLWALVGASWIGAVLYYMKFPKKQPLKHHHPLWNPSPLARAPQQRAPGSTRATPAQLPKRGWQRALRSTYEGIKNKGLTTLASSVAYYATLSFFPAIIALVSIYVATVGPAQVKSAAAAAQHLLPSATAGIVTKELMPLAANTTKSLVSGIVAVAIALFSASTGMENLIRALNHAYSVEEKRGIIKLRAISLGLIIVIIILALPIMALILLRPEMLISIGWSPWLAHIITVARWVLLAALLMIALAAFYRYAPNRIEPRWQIVTWGSVIATIIWLIGTGLFFMYVQYLADFSRTYGTFAGLIILMIWFYLSAFCVLLGAEINSHLEHETRMATH